MFCSTSLSKFLSFLQFPCFSCMLNVFSFFCKDLCRFLRWRMLHLPSLFHDLGVAKPPRMHAIVTTKDYELFFVGKFRRFTSKWESYPGRGENTYIILKPPPSLLVAESLPFAEAMILNESGLSTLQI